MKNDLTKIAEILKTTVEELENNQKDLVEEHATYYWNPVRGGLSMIVGEYGDYLCATSSINFDELLKEFKSGHRNGSLNNVFTNFLEMSSDEIKTLINQKYNLLNDKINGIIDNHEKENSGYLFWNCKMLLINIKMACNKLLKTYKEDLTSEEVSHYENLANLITQNEQNWQAMDDIKETVNSLVK